MDNVRLVGITQPVGIDFVENPTAENLVAYCARVSNPANQENPEAEKLLKYCIRNQHWSIFEMVHVVMEISTTRDIARQILRHRSFSFQEFSQRYAEVQEPFTIREARLQDNKNRQNSIENDNAALDSEWYNKQVHLGQIAMQTYEWAIKSGIAKEQARVVLPEGLTMSRMYMAGSLRSWIHYCELRMGNGTQKEHRLIAQQCWNIILQQFPSFRGIMENEG